MMQAPDASFSVCILLHIYCTFAFESFWLIVQEGYPRERIYQDQYRLLATNAFCLHWTYQIHVQQLQGVTGGGNALTW
jgi:hypothetical protein